MTFRNKIFSLSFRGAKLVCSSCKDTSTPWDTLSHRCTKCNEPLEVQYDLKILESVLTQKKFENRSFNMWKYQELLPFESFDQIVTLYEGGTPLFRAKNLEKQLGITQLQLKDETRNPTNSFKDRGSAIGMTKAKELASQGRIQAVGTVSTGNMAASIAAFAAKAQLPCVILIQPDTSMQKVAQTAICGVNVVAVEGAYGKMYEESLRIGQKIGVFFINSDSPWRIEGQKTVAFEICDQLDWKVPDHLFIPVSSGGNISAIFKGFEELYETGLISQIPHIIGVQAEGNSPIAHAYFKKKETVEAFPEPSTIAHAISNPDPPSGTRVLRLLRKFEGYMVTVSDKEILDAQRLLAAQEGIFAEPAAVTTLAALKRLLEEGIIEKSETVVCVLTGHGLKDVNVLIDRLPEPMLTKLEKLEISVRSLFSM